MSFAQLAAQRRGYFLIALAVLILDQASKIAAHHWLAGERPLVVIPGWFNLSYSRNAGGLFGYFRDLPDPWRLLLLTALPTLAVLMIVWFLVYGVGEDRLTLFGLSLILGGALGNLIDRAVRGEVVDFLDVYVSPPRLADWFVGTFGTAHWPTFNVADSAIVTGACLLFWTIVRPPASEPASSGHGSEAVD